MAYTPTSPEGVACQKLARMLALSSTFQGLCSGGYSEALTRINYIESPLSGFPRATVAIVAGMDEQIAGGSAVYTRPRVNLHLYLAIAPDSTLELKDQQLKGLDTLAKIIGEIDDLNGVDDADSVDSHLCIRSRSTPIYEETPRELWNVVDPNGEQGEVLGHFFWCETTFEVGDG